MFKLSNLISRNRASKTKDSLTSDQLANLTVFSQNLNLYNTITTKNEQIRLFETLLSQFKGTFDSISYDQLQNHQVIECLEKYCLICANVGSNVVKNIDESKKMFDSILFIFHMLSYLPYDNEFITLFFEVIHEAKRSPKILDPAYDIITLMFTSQKFYNLFVEKDGFTDIFINFYIKCISYESQNFFNILFFESIPKDYHTKYPPQSLLTLFVEIFNKDEIDPPHPACAKFVVNYLTAFHHSADPALFDRFNDLNGFSILNGFFIKNYQTAECVDMYKKLLIESQSDPHIVTSLYKLYRDKEATPNFRTLIINLISLSINNVFSFEKFNATAPIHLWILFPPELDREGFIMLTILLKDLSEKRMYSIKPALDSILKLIQPPGNDVAPIDSFLELIETAIAQRELKPSELLSKKFLEDFILIPSSEDVAKYFEEHVLFGSVVVSVYSSELTNDYRYPVIQKFIESSQFLKNMTDFIEFLSSLFSRHFGAETVSLLLNFLNNDDLANLLAKELSKRNLGYHYLMESNGLLSFEDFLSTESEGENIDQKKGEKIVNILAAISTFGPKEEINEWINEQPINSPIFKCERSFLAKAIYAFKSDTTILHIPSFLPFTDDFDTTSMINLYLAGKFGVRAFKKFNKALNQIPNYKIISDRFVYPEDIENYLNLNEQIIDLSVNHYSVFEFVPLLEKCFIVLPFYQFVYFTFCFPRFSSSPVPLIKINKTFTIVVENGHIVIKNLKNSDSVSFTIESNKWHKVVFSFKPLTKKINLMIDAKKISTFHLDEEGSPFVFGDDEKPLLSTFMISTQILVSEKPISNFNYIWKMSSTTTPKDLISAQFKQSESVYLASYQGLATYFQNFIDLEMIFKRIDETKSQQEFEILISTLLKIRIINEISGNSFYDRLLLSFKRQKEFISESLVNNIYLFPTKYCFKKKRKMKYIQYILSDIELFHMFNDDKLIELLKIINNELIDGFEMDASNSSLLLQNLFNLIRTGLSNQLILNIVPIIVILITNQPTISKYRFLLNTAISASEWNVKSNEYLSLLSKPLPDNKIHYHLLETFFKLAQMCPDTELYNYRELLDFMLLFDDERSLLFAGLISIYSKRNPKYLSESSLACFAFSRHCESINCWIRAFAILSGEVAGDIVQTSLFVQRPVFIPVIIEMLSSLCSKSAIFALSNETEEKVNEYLIRQILDIILTLPSEQYKYFLQQSCQIPLMILSNVGMIPKTIQAAPATYSTNSNQLPTIITSFSPAQSPKSLRSASLPPTTLMRDTDETPSVPSPIRNLNEQNQLDLPLPSQHQQQQNAGSSTETTEKKRIPSNWSSFTPTRLSRDELKSAFSLCDKVTPFSNQIMENDSLITSQTQPKYFNQIDPLPDNVDNNKWVDQLSFRTSLMTLFSNILFQSEPSNFGSHLFDFVIGHSLMYDSYSHYFAQELIFTVIIRMTISDVPLELYHKPMFRLILKCVKTSLFNDRYTHLLSLIFNMMKSLQVKNEFESILSDPTIMSCYREIIIRSFLFVTGNDLIELFQLFTTYKIVVFYPPVFANTEFALFWIHIVRFNELDNQDAIMCLNLLMSMFDHPIINEYKADEINEKWKLFKQKITQNEFESSDYTFRLKRAKSIISYTINKLQRASKEHLLISVFRIANFYIQSNSQIFSLNSKMRNYEMNFYRMIQDEQKYRLQKELVCKSFHLSSNPMPLNQSLAVVPSPFEIKSPEFDQKTSTDFFMIEKEVFPPRIKQIITDGRMVCSPEWHQFNSHKMMFSSPFEYSQFINNSPILPMLKFAFMKYGPFSTQLNADLFYFSHPIPSVILIGEKAMIVLIHARLVTKASKRSPSNNNNEADNENANDADIEGNGENNGENNSPEIEEKLALTDEDIELIEKIEHPISYIPFSESVTLNEWHRSSLFCGHITLVFDFERMMTISPYLYLHKNCALNISSLFDPPLILIFQSQNESENVKKILTKMSSKSVRTQLPAFPFLVTVNSVHKATEMWSNGLLSNYRYLLLLNHFGGRCFSDLGQYPIFPWVISPNLETIRDLSLPMGQLDKERAEHYDSTYENSQKYFYGCHYSQPNSVSWLLMRLPPFIYFQWDLNNGWDNSQRLFVSINDAFNSASKTNNMDLKELIPAIYTVPEIFTNSAHLVFSSSSIENISLPDWAGNSPYHYVEVMLKALQSTERLHEWIDLIFGYKQTGEFATQAKNLFLPTSYHSASPESLDMDPVVFEAQVNNFGQCPIQLFTKPHPQRICKPLNTILKIDKDKGFLIESTTIKNKLFQSSSSPISSSLTYLYSMSAQSFSPTLTQIKSSRSLLFKSDNSQKISFSSSYSSITMSASHEALDSILQPPADSEKVDQEKTDIQPADDIEKVHIENTVAKPQKASKKVKIITNVQNLYDSQRSASSPSLERQEHDSALNAGQTPNQISQQPSTYSAVSLLSMINYGSSGYNKSLTLCDEGVFLLPGLADSIPPRHSHFISVDSSAANCRLSSVTEKRPIFLITSSEFALATHVSVSTNGVFAVFSFANGFVQVGQIVHLLKKPVSLRFFSSFWLPMGCSHSVLFSIDFICASLFLTSDSRHVVFLWNYATQLLHRVIHPEIRVLGMFADDNQGTLTLYGKNDIVQYTINGLLVRSYHSEYDITSCVLFHYNPTFDGRFIVTGDTRGQITFLSSADTRENDTGETASLNSKQPWFESFTVVGSKAVHNHPIASLFFSFSRECIASVDTRGNAFLTRLNLSDCKVVSNATISHSAPVKKTIAQSFSTSSIGRLSSNNLTSTDFENQTENESEAKLEGQILTIVDQQSQKRKEEEAQNKPSRICKSNSSFLFTNFDGIEVEQEKDSISDVRCAICENAASKKCKNCGIPLCSSCIDDGTELCPNCHAELMNSLD